MKIELTNCVVSAEYEYGEDDSENYPLQKKKFFLRVRVPLPGGYANYQFPIDEMHYKSLEHAKKLSEAK